MSPSTHRRGYPVATLIGIENNIASLWQVFSLVAKHQQTISLLGNRNDAKALYSFHESIINTLRPTLKEGVRSVIIASPPRTDYAQEFLSHIKAHHSWLFQSANKTIFSPIAGSASTPQQVAALTKTNTFKQLISDTTTQETENLLEILKKGSTQQTIWFSFLCKKQNPLSLTLKPKESLSPIISFLQMNIFLEAAKNIEFKDSCRLPQTKGLRHA